MNKKFEIWRPIQSNQSKLLNLYGCGIKRTKDDKSVKSLKKNLKLICV